MATKLAVGCFIFVMTAQVAVAGVVEDCHQERGPEVRVRACTEIIKGPSFKPEEKSLAYASRGKARADAGADREALADFTESIRLKKDNLSAFAGRGRARLALGNLAGSITDFSEAIRLSPASAELYVQRGHAYTVSKKADAAIGDLTQALRLDPRSWSAFNERGIAHGKKGDLVRAQGGDAAAQEQYAAALEDYTAAIAIAPFPVIYANRGYLHESQGRTEDAIKDLRQALLGDPSLVDAKNALKRLGAAEAVTTETDRRVRQGATLAEKNCTSCHAVGASGVSPNKDAVEFRNVYRSHQLYALRESIAQGVIATHDKMPQYKLSFEDTDTIVAYINSLSTGR